MNVMETKKDCAGYGTGFLDGAGGNSAISAKYGSWIEKELEAPNAPLILGR
ncbi:hypothetical protein KCP70_01420 [Salmonella enterica subsp. enterica]|nr:hypothetical protein KCP70_01420 [Salmonella enterica subsp. enterica]